MRRPDRPFHRGSSVARRGILIVAIPLVLQIVLLLVLGRAQLRQESDRLQGLRANQLKMAAQTLSLLLVDSETGMRGFVLTGNDAFAEPYRQAARGIPEQLATIRRLAFPGQETQVAELSARVSDALTFHRENIDRVRARRHAEAAAMIRLQIGKQRMDRFRVIARQFLDSVDAQLAQRDAAARAASSRLLTWLWIAMIANVIVALVAGRIFSAQITRRLETIIDNERRLAGGLPLHEPLQGRDEIAVVDFYFHEMAAQLVRNRSEIEDAMRELESFSYSVSHDLRAPLRAVSGYAQILDEDYADVLDAEGRRYLAAVRSESKRMGELIDDLLTFSRLSRAQIQATTVDIEAIVAEIERGVIAHEPGRTIEVRCHDLPRACGDRSMVRQVLVNLIGNAVKFSSRSAATIVEVTGSCDGHECTYAVRDRGVGFDMRYADKLFRTFERLHPADQFDGTGIGLAIVERIVRRHGGRVWAEGAVGQGACFYFTLPAPAAEEKVA